jgi:hypothetical protein
VTHNSMSLGGLMLDATNDRRPRRGHIALHGTGTGALQRLKINLPEQPPPRITKDGIPKHNDRPLCGADLATPRPRKSNRLRDC